MHNQRKPIVIAALILAAVSPTLLAQNKQPNSSTSPNTGSAIAEGKILWQYNTEG